MYKDVKKKLLAMVLCICMIIGAVEVVPRVQAAATVGGNTVTITGKDPQLNPVECVLHLETLELAYTGEPQVPKIKYATVGTATIDGSENWKLSLSSGSDGINVGTYECYLEKGNTGKYSFEVDATKFNYSIIQAKITDYEVTLKNKVSVWQKDQTYPDIEYVKVTLNSKKKLTLDKTQYEVTANAGIGTNKVSILTIKDTTNIDTVNSLQPDTIKYTIAYPLNGTTNEGTTEKEMRVESPTADYTGSTLTPNIRIYDGNDWTTEVEDNVSDFSSNFTTTYYKKNASGDFVQIKQSEIRDAGTYKIKVDAGESYAQLGSIYYTGIFEGLYTVTAKGLAQLRVVADDVAQNEKGVTIFENEKQTKTLVYGYANGEKVSLQNVQVWDDSANPQKNVTDQFTQEYKNATEIGTAFLRLIPKSGQSNYGAQIDIDYYITSDIEITDIQFEGYDVGVTDLYYSGKPMIPATYKVTDKLGGEITSYDVSYGYQLDGTWFETTDRNHEELKTTGTKRICVNAKGAFSGKSAYKEYTISAVDMSEGSKFYGDFTLELDPSDVEGSLADGYYTYYSGEPREPKVILKYGVGTNPKTELTEGTDYRISYSADHTNGGEVTVTVTGLSGSSYTGSRSTKFVIMPVDLANAAVVGDAGGIGFSYTGAGIVPRIELKDGSNYTYVLRTSDYKVIKYYDVNNQKELTSAPKDVGKYQITIQNINKQSNIKGSTITLDYDIVVKDISSDSDSVFILTGVSGENREIEWNGGKTDPEVVCGTMQKGTDFEVTYAGDTAPGPVSGASVTIVGKGNYQGIKELKYTITPRSLENPNMSAKASVQNLGGYKYNATISVQDQGVNANGKVLVEGTDYEITSVTYKSDSTDAHNYNQELTNLPKAGEYEAVLTGKDKYKDRITVKIGCGIDISDGKLSIAYKSVNFTGSPITPAGVTLTYTDADGKKDDVDYNYTNEANSPFFLEYERDDDTARRNANVSAGEVYLVAEGNPAYGFYGKTTSRAKFTIKALDINQSNYKIDITDTRGMDVNGTYTVPYTGFSWENIVFVVKDSTGTKELKYDEDYTVSFEGDCIQQSTHLIWVTGKGNYTGTIGKSFKIGQTPIDSPEITVDWGDVASSSYAEGEPTPIIKFYSHDLVKDKDYWYNTPTKIASPASIGWNNYRKYTINGMGNFTGTRIEYVPIIQTPLKEANSAEDWQPGEVYIDSWIFSELRLDPTENPIKRAEPDEFTLSYKKQDGTTVALKKDTDYKVIGYGTNTQPGTSSGNYVIIEGKDGCVGEVQFPVTLYTDIEKAEFLQGSTIVSGGSISLSTLEAALNSANPSAELAKMVSLKNMWPDEVGGMIDPANFTVTVPGGYTPHIGEVVFTIAGTQQAPKYYDGSRQVKMTVTGALDGDQIRVEIGDNNTVAWQGVEVTPDNTRVQVYDGNKLLTGGYLAAGAVAPADWDYTVTFSNNSSIGLGLAMINGINKYSEVLTQPFKITYPMSDLIIQVQDDEGKWEDYAGGTQSYEYKIDPVKNKPAVKLYYQKDPNDENSRSQISTDLYSVTWNGYENAGNANIIIGEPTNEDYQGILLGNNRVISYLLNPIPLENVKIEMANSTPTYSGNPIEKDELGLSLTYGTYILTEADYTLAYYDNINAYGGEGKKARVAIAANGNFSGYIEKEFTIRPMPIYSEKDINAIVDDLIYTGAEQIPNVKLNQVTGRLYTLKEGVDYEIVAYLDSAKNELEQPPKAIGNYYVKIKGLGNYKERGDDNVIYRLVPYSIIERQMQDGVEISFVGTESCPVADGVPVCVYNGSAHEPGIQVVYNGQILKGIDDASTPDYLVEYTNNVDAGVATITITGNGSFAGTRTMDFKITPKDIAGEDMEFRDANGNIFVDEAEYEWTKTTVQPEIAVYDKTMKTSLTKGEGAADYTVTYTDYNEDDNTQCNAGKVYITVTGTGNYGGTKEYSYYIGEDISKLCALVDGKQSLTTNYNGLMQAPSEERITVSGTASVDIVDENGNKRYRIAYYKDGFEAQNLITRDEMIDAATYYVAVVGEPTLGTYARSSADNSCTFIIHPRSVAPAYVLVSGYDGTYYYTGQPIEPKGIIVEDTDLPVSADETDPQRRSVKLIQGVDYELSYSNNVSAGKASIIVTGKGNYSGNRAAYFNIVSSDTTGNNTWDGTSEGTGSMTNGTTTISASDITLGYDNSMYDCMMYNGYERIPTVSINGVSTNEFIVTASNNIRPGVATLMITGRNNNFTGTIIKHFTIKADLSAYGSISAIADQTYTGYQITPYVTVTCGGNLLNQNTDYSVTYLNNTNVGRATVMVHAASDSYYIGTATGGFNISNVATGMQITGYASSYTYTGYAITPDVVVTMNDRVLTRGVDYYVSYSNNTNVGTATMTVTGIGSFSGVKTIPFAIEAKNIENCLATAVTSYNYTGNTYTPSVTVTDSSTGKTLVAGTDYTITYSNNTNPGTASITVTALSKNYTGSKVIPFKITSAAVSGLRTSKIKNNSIKLSWSAQDYADGYQICNSNNRVIATTTKNSYTIKSLKSCTTYKFKVRSYVENSDGTVSYGSFSTAVSAKTLLNTPKLTVKSKSKGKVTLSWTKVSNASGYEIYYSTKKNGVYTRLKTVSKSSKRTYVDSGLASGEKYYYTIRAYRTVNGVKTYSSYNTIKAVTVK